MLFSPQYLLVLGNKDSHSTLELIDENILYVFSKIVNRVNPNGTKSFCLHGTIFMSFQEYTTFIRRPIYKGMCGSVLQKYTLIPWQLHSEQYTFIPVENTEYNSYHTYSYISAKSCQFTYILIWYLFVTQLGIFSIKLIKSHNCIQHG